MNIKDLRNLTGLSCNAFGELYKIPAHTLNNWEQGIRKPPVYVMELLERAVLEDFADTDPSHSIRYAVIETAPYGPHITVCDSRDSAMSKGDAVWADRTMEQRKNNTLTIGLVEVDTEGKIKTGEVLSVVKEYKAE